jgi:hypothetical protein
VVQEQFPDLKEQRARAVIKEWADNKMFEIGDYDDPKQRKPLKGILSARSIGKKEWGEED